MMAEIRRAGTIHADETDSPSRVHVPELKGFSRKFIFLVLCAALLINAGMVLGVLPGMASPLAVTYSMGFGDLYDLIANNLVLGNGYRVEPEMGQTMLREPGYPLVLAVAFKIAGYGISQARVVCVLLAFGAALILFRLTRKITANPTAALIAAVLFLLYPGVLIAEERAGIEVPSILTLLLFMLALYSAADKGSLWRYGAAGLLLGVAALTRSEVMLFPSVLLLYFLFTARDWAERVRVVGRIAVLGVGALLVMSPWIIRNYMLVHQLVPSATVAGVAAQEGLYTCVNAATGESFALGQTRAGYERADFAMRMGKPFLGQYYQLFYTPQDESAFNQTLLRHVSTEYRSHPELMARCAAKNLVFNFWFLGKTLQSTLANVAMQAPLLGLALVGVVVLRRRGLLRNANIVLLYILYIPAVHALIIAHARHSMLIVPFLAILAGVGFVSVWPALRMQNSGFDSEPSPRPGANQPLVADHLSLATRHQS
jgi:4-amino-4-deoxy-L-arabinose transferase-like glycosyltransferase